MNQEKLCCFLDQHNYQHLTNKVFCKQNTFPPQGILGMAQLPFYLQDYDRSGHFLLLFCFEQTLTLIQGRCSGCGLAWSLCLVVAMARCNSSGTLSAMSLSGVLLCCHPLYPCWVHHTSIGLIYSLQLSCYTVQVVGLYTFITTARRITLKPRYKFSRYYMAKYPLNLTIR